MEISCVTRHLVTDLFQDFRVGTRGVRDGI